MFVITFESNVPSDLAQEFRSALEVKFTQLAKQLYDKVMENVSGKILEQRTGELAGSIRQLTDISGDFMTTILGPVPETPKAFALEYGGSEFYPIFPSKAKVLHFFWSKIGQEVWLPSVNHPPSREFAYMRSALAELEGAATEEMRETAARVLGG